MKTENMLMIGAIAVVVIGLGVAFFVVSGSSDNTESNNQITGFASKTTGTTGTNDVEIELKPYNVESGIMNVDIYVNTHSVDLSPFDLNQIITLEYKGKAIKPSSAPALSGHHASGTLTFGVGKDISNFKIVIKGIPDIEERVYDW